jgi:ribosomal protein S18 acetylase RimI-like enzyme
VEIDHAGPTDADAVAAVFGAARREAMPWLPRVHTEAEDRSFFAGVIEDSEVLVVRREEGVVGFLARKDDLVEHLYVRPEAQRAGIGSALLEDAKTRHPSGLQLWVFQRNQGARAFYAGQGFVEVRLTDGSANEEREPDVLLAWTP